MSSITTTLNGRDTATGARDCAADVVDGRIVRTSELTGATCAPSFALFSNAILISPAAAKKKAPAASDKSLSI